ncbi:hypothetical protein QF026_008394 [Streptomyces aurantiacus]|nr:hypothetical protein [Streptomyces aurantiacus]
MPAGAPRGFRPAPVRRDLRSRRTALGPRRPPTSSTVSAARRPSPSRRGRQEWARTVPAKLTGWPKYESYRAPERFQDIARTLGLAAASPDEGVESLAVERLRDAVGIEPSFQALGIDEKAFLEALPQQSLNAYEDQCAPANPRMPMLDDMREIMRTAYYGPVDMPGE